jgi:hypothetical protein
LHNVAQKHPQLEGRLQPLAQLKLMNAIDCQLVRVEPLEALPPL